MVQRNAYSSRHLHAVCGRSRVLFPFYICHTVYGPMAKRFHPYDNASHISKLTYSLLICNQVKYEESIYMYLLLVDN